MIHRMIIKRRLWILTMAGVLFGVLLTLSMNQVVLSTSTDEYCQSCHIHTQADESWTQASHYRSATGTRTGCVDCHLPPRGDFKYLRIKAKTGLHDLYAFHFKNHESFNWEEKRELEYAVNIVYNKSCENCHPNLFPQGLSAEGGDAHLYYDEHADDLNLQCINCHLDVGHSLPNYKHEKMAELPVSDQSSKKLFKEAAELTAFRDFTEKIPNTSVSFKMVAVEGGTFQMGSPKDEPFRKAHEGPVRNVTISPFFMSEVEVTWDAFWTFYSQTMSEGRMNPEAVYANNANAVDGISGPTPPFGNPDQGWGVGNRPAITMSHYAAETYCQWLSMVTGKKYRLPTEAEWEYACRGGTQGAYFFEGDPKRLSEQSFRSRLLGVDTTIISRYVIYAMNSGARTQMPDDVAANPFGLKNMSGNVYEYCSDFYAEDAYEQTDEVVKNPAGPASGTEYVIRGGFYGSDAADLRSAARFSTRTDEWLRTDCQQPKSIWWLSDIKGIGFRLVCEMDSLDL